MAGLRSNSAERSPTTSTPPETTLLQIMLETVWLHEALRSGSPRSIRTRSTHGKTIHDGCIQTRTACSWHRIIEDHHHAVARVTLTRKLSFRPPSGNAHRLHVFRIRSLSQEIVSRTTTTPTNPQLSLRIARAALGRCNSFAEHHDMAGCLICVPFYCLACDEWHVEEADAEAEKLPRYRTGLAA